MRQDAARKRLVFLPPLGVHVGRGGENLIDRHAEPFHDASIHEAEGKQEQKCRGNQSERNEGDEEARFEFRAGLLLFTLDPDFYQGAKKHETEDQEDQKNERRERVEQDDLSRFGWAEEGVQVERGLDKYKQRQ